QRGGSGHYSGRRGPPPKPRRQMAQQPMLNPFGPPSGSRYMEEYAGERDGGQERNEDSPVVAFVSGIAVSVEDEWIRKILDACCNIVTWRRAYDSDERPQSFGFCEFQTAGDALLAIRVLSSTRGLKKGGWVLPDVSKRDAEAKPLSITIDVSMQSFLDAQLTMLESSNDDADQSKNASALSALESVKGIIKELEESISGKQKDSETEPLDKDGNQRKQIIGDDDEDLAQRKADNVLDGSRPGGSADDDGEARSDNHDSAEHEDGSEAGNDKAPVSLEDEESWEKEKLQQSRYRRYVVSAEERERRMAKEQVDREERMERSAMRELDRVEERQRDRDSMAEMLLEWDDKKERCMRKQEYYRDRERWWHHRKSARAREIELDDEDRRREEHEQREKKSMIETEGINEPMAKASMGSGEDELDSSKAEHTPKPGAIAGRREQIETLIKEIPTETDALFAWPLKWDFVDEQVLVAKIEPAVSKRLHEYLGNDADDGSVDELTGFIVGHIRDHNSPSSLAEELEMVLVDEAPVFVARIWRVVVYESEARARGLV
ncbi:hypothetical protein EV175_004638, partial [Coemansia sp. RSA 1933]